MIPRHQKFLFGFLLLASVGMGILLWQLRERAHQRMIAGQDSAPTSAPQIAVAEEATLMVASDSDGSLRAQSFSLPLPADPGSRARAVLAKLLDLYAAPESTHPVPGGGGAVLQVFLLPAPKPGGSAPDAGQSDGSISAAPQNQPPSGPQLAVVNLAGGFAANHPSGIATETLTVLSICGTLHANLPRVTQVRFLVDGVERETLAGHADLTRTYLAGEDAPQEGAHP
jgi:hypothetical protein